MSTTDKHISTTFHFRVKLTGIFATMYGLLGRFLDTLNIYTLLLGAAIPVLFYFWYRLPRNMPPNPFGLPFIGNLYSVLRMKYPPEDLKVLSDKYGPIMTLSLGPIKAAILSDHATINEAFVVKAHQTSGRPAIHRTGPTRATGVIMKDGKAWRSVRRFSLSTLRDFGYGRNLIQEVILEEVGFIEDSLDQQPDAIYRDIRHMFTLATANVTSSLIYGKRFDYNDPMFKKVINSLDMILRKYNFMDSTKLLDKIIPITSYQKKRKSAQRNNVVTVTGFTQTLIDEHKHDFDVDNIRDFVDVYLKMQNTETSDFLFGDEDIRCVIIDLFIAGTETTATSLAWGLLAMIAFPEIQKKCQREIDKLIDGNRRIQLKDRLSLPYLDATICEIQRYGSVVPLGVSHRATEDLTISGFFVPCNTLLMSNLYAIHHDKRVFEVPEVFRPERFLDSEGRVTNTDLVIPFSVGPRTCLGEGLARSELFLIFANLLNDFAFTKEEGTILDLTPVPYNSVIREPQCFNAKVERRNVQ